MGFLSLGFLYQYVSEYFKWSLRDTAHLQLTRATGMTISTVVAIPLISSFIISKQRVPPERLDQALVIGSALILASSFAAIWTVQSTFGLLLGESILLNPKWHSLF
jgi:hypothetical protein